MRIKHLFALIHIHNRNKGEVGTVKHVQAFQYFFLLTVPRWFYFCGSFLLLYFVFVYHTGLSVPYSLVVTCWEWADFSALLYVMFSCVFVAFPCGVLDQVWYLIVLIPDLCIIPYFS